MKTLPNNYIKNSLKNQPDLHKPFSSPEIETILLTIDTQLEQTFTLQGKHDGQKTIELTEVAFKVKVINVVQSKIQTIIDFIRQKSLVAAKVLQAKEIEKIAKEKCEQAHNEINHKEHEIAALNRKKDLFVVDHQKIKLSKWVSPVAVVAGIVDGSVANYSFAQSLSWMLALAGAFSIAIVIALSHLVYTPWIKKSENDNQKLFKVILILFIALLFFAYMANLRASAVNDIVNITIPNSEVAPQVIPHVSQLLICIISFILFAFIVFFSLRFWQSPEEKLQEKIYKKLCAEIKQKLLEITVLEQEIKAYEKSVYEQKQEARTWFDYVKKSIKRAKNIGLSAISTYKKVYVDFHSITPLFFKDQTVLTYDEELHFFETENAII